MTHSVREQITKLDPTMAVFNVETMQEHVDKSLLLPRISALLLGSSGCGSDAGGHRLVWRHELFGSLPDARNRHPHGAWREACAGLRMVLRQGLTLTGIGLAIGLVIALALGRFSASVLYGTSGTDLLTFAIVSAVLLTASTAAILVPASRAARVEPTTALRYE